MILMYAVYTASGTQYITQATRFISFTVTLYGEAPGHRLQHRPTNSIKTSTV